MKYLVQARKMLLSVMLIALTVRVIWWSVMPLIPYLIFGVVLLSIIGVAIFRRW